MAQTSAVSDARLSKNSMGRGVDVDAVLLRWPVDEVDDHVNNSLLEASDRLDHHLLDGPFDPYFKLVLLACSAAAYGALEQFVADRVDRANTDPDMRELPDADPHQDTLQLIDAFAVTAGADRAVRTVTWAILGNVIARDWSDRWQEIVDIVTAAVPLSPAGLAAVAAHIDTCRRWNELSADWQAKQDEDDFDDELDPRAEELFTGSFAWLLTSVLQWSPEDENRTLHIDALRWGFVLLSAFDDYPERLRELEGEYPDAVPKPET